MIENVWTHVAYLFNKIDFYLYVNGETNIADHFTLTNMVLDVVENTDVVGENYIGFVYSICMKQRAVTSFSIDLNPSCTENDCSICPESTCLSNCGE